MLQPYEMTRVDRTLDKVPDGIRRYLDSWRFWLGVAYVGVAIAIVLGYSSLSKTTREQAARSAETQATAATTYRNCVKSRPLLQKVNSHLQGDAQIAAVLVLNARLTLDETSPESPSYQAAKVRLARLVGAQKRIDAIGTLPVPTVAQCAAEKAAILHE